MSYLEFLRSLTFGLKCFQSPVGERFVAALALQFDGIADSARGGFFSSLPGHPEQYSDSLDEVARSRRLIKFGNEDLAAWKAYVLAAWDTYSKFVTEDGVLAAVERWGLATFPVDWTPGGATLAETGFANFEVTLPSGLPAFDVPHTFGDGLTYGGDGVYGSSGSARSFSLLRSAVRQAKPARSKGTIILPFSTLPWTGTLLSSRLVAPAVTVEGESVLGVRAEVEITGSGSRGTATFSFVVYDADDNPLYVGVGTTSPSNNLGASGITVNFSAGSYLNGDTYVSVAGFNVVTRLVLKV
jgi:hypothetical protein